MSLDPRDYDYRRLRQFAADIEGGCPNGPDEYGDWPCDPKGYFGVAECQVCGRVGTFRRLEPTGFRASGVAAAPAGVPAGDKEQGT